MIGSSANALSIAVDGILQPFRFTSAPVTSLDVLLSLGN